MTRDKGAVCEKLAHILNNVCKEFNRVWVKLKMRKKILLLVGSVMKSVVHRDRFLFWSEEWGGVHV